MAFQCVIVTPEQQVMDESVLQVILPAHDGLVGILTDRAPLLVKLGVGPLRVDLPNKERRYFFVDGGVAQMKDNHLTLLTKEATPATEIHAEAAQADYKAAMAQKGTDPQSLEQRQHLLQRARAKQELAR
jgi:F-type H+-transporting ATPase subunit epsilon